MPVKEKGKIVDCVGKAVCSDQITNTKTKKIEKSKIKLIALFSYLSYFHFTASAQLVYIILVGPTTLLTLQMVGTNL